MSSTAKTGEEKVKEVEKALHTMLPPFPIIINELQRILTQVKHILLLSGRLSLQELSHTSLLLFFYYFPLNVSLDVKNGMFPVIMCCLMPHLKD